MKFKPSEIVIPDELLKNTPCNNLSSSDGGVASRFNVTLLSTKIAVTDWITFIYGCAKGIIEILVKYKGATLCIECPEYFAVLCLK